MLKGEGRQQEIALSAAESVLGSILIPADATAAYKASPAFAKASGEDAHMAAAAADAHTASEHSLRAAARQLARSQRQQKPRSAETLTPTSSHTAKRTSGLRADALQSTTTHTLQVALPGVRAEDLRIEVEGRRLTISGLPPKPKHGHFVSTWRLPSDADTRRASAELDNGVLRITFSRSP